MTLHYGCRQEFASGSMLTMGVKLLPLSVRNQSTIARVHYGGHPVQDALSKKHFRILAWIWVLGPGWLCSHCSGACWDAACTSQ